MRGGGSVRHVGIILAVHIEPEKESDAADVVHKRVFIKIAAFLCKLYARCIQIHGDGVAVDEIVIHAGNVASVIENELDGLEVYLIRRPVVFVENVGDGVLFGHVRAKELSADGDVVLIRAVNIARLRGGFGIFGKAERATLRKEVAPAKGNEISALEQAHEICRRRLEGILEGIVVKRLYADG